MICGALRHKTPLFVLIALLVLFHDDNGMWAGGGQVDFQVACLQGEGQVYAFRGQIDALRGGAVLAQLEAEAVRGPGLVDMGDRLQRPARVEGDHVDNAPGRVLIRLRLGVEGGFYPTWPTGDQQGRRHEVPQGAAQDFAVSPVIVGAVAAEQRGSDIEHIIFAYHQGGVQRVTDRGMLVAGEVLPGAGKQGALQLAVALCAGGRIDQVGLDRRRHNHSRW